MANRDGVSNELTAVVVDVLLTIPEFVDPSSRQLILTELGGLGTVIPRHSAARLDAFSVVATCRRYPGGLLQLVTAIRQAVGEVPEVQDLAQAVDRLIQQEGCD